MPASNIVIYNPSGEDAFGSGKLLQDSGVISDLDGGFDTASAVILVRKGSAAMQLREAHPHYPGMFLFGISPRRIIGGDEEVTLTYKGFNGRNILTGAAPTLGSADAKFTWGIQMAQKTWGVGDLSGTVDGVDLSEVAVNVMQPMETVKVSWMGNAKVDSNVFRMQNGRSPHNYGPIDEGFYDTIENPAYNYPHGWVPTDSSSEQAYAGLGIYLNSVTFTAIPKFSPA